MTVLTKRFVLADMEVDMSSVSARKLGQVQRRSAATIIISSSSAHSSLESPVRGAKCAVPNKRLASLSAGLWSRYSLSTNLGWIRVLYHVAELNWRYNLTRLLQHRFVISSKLNTLHINYCRCLLLKMTSQLIYRNFPNLLLERRF